MKLAEVSWVRPKPRETQRSNRMAAAAQVDSLDQSVGRIMDTLRRTHADTNTLVLFFSDNGASDQPPPSQLVFAFEILTTAAKIILANAGHEPSVSRQSIGLCG